MYLMSFNQKYIIYQKFYVLKDVFKEFNDNFGFQEIDKQSHNNKICKTCLNSIDNLGYCYNKTCFNFINTFSYIDKGNRIKLRDIMKLSIYPSFDKIEISLCIRIENLTNDKILFYINNLSSYTLLIY